MQNGVTIDVMKEKYKKKNVKRKGKSKKKLRGKNGEKKRKEKG